MGYMGKKEFPPPVITLVRDMALFLGKIHTIIYDYSGEQDKQKLVVDI